MSSGEEKAWGVLADLEPDDVCKRAQVCFDKVSGLYTLRSFGMDVSVCPRDKKIQGQFPESDVLLKRLGHFSRLALLRYLIDVKDIRLSGDLIKPINLKGGHLFFRGSHVLPVDKIVGKFSEDTRGFLLKGKALDAEQLSFGDASLRLFPFPRVPVVLILWRADEEFPARADLLFDKTCELQLPLDIIWSTAMMSLLIML